LLRKGSLRNAEVREIFIQQSLTTRTIAAIVAIVTIATTVAIRAIEAKATTAALTQPQPTFQ